MNAVTKWLVVCVLLVGGLAAMVQAQAQPKLDEAVWAEWKRNLWFRGKVAKIDGKDFHIAYDDGDKGTVEATGIALDRIPKETEVKLNARVLAKFKKAKFFPGKIAGINADKSYDIKFDDGDTDTVTLEELRLIAK